MGRWTRYTDPDVDNLPHGMRRVGYNADSQSYTYQDKDGSLWTSASGMRYGELRPLNKEPKAKPASASKRQHKKSESMSSTSKKSEIVESPTEMTGNGSLRSSRMPKRTPAPAPPYEKPSRRFTNFDQLYEGKKKEGFLSAVKRGLSVRKERPTGPRERRGTL